MREVTMYECKWCHNKYDDAIAAAKCEKSHSIEEKMSLSNGIICPDCNGKGYTDGVDGFDIITCGTCKGDGVVKVCTTTKTVLKPVD